MMEEIWKDIQGYEGRYQVSNMGRVRRLTLPMKTPTGYHCHLKAKIRKPTLDKTTGYMRLILTDGHNKKSFNVHRLVAIHFVPGYKPELFVNHKNEIRFDNRAENLEWCTPRYNLEYSDVSNRNKKAVCQYSSDGNFLRTFDSIKEAAIVIGVRPNNISCCCRGKYKKSAGYIWRFAK